MFKSRKFSAPKGPIPLKDIVSTLKATVYKDGIEVSMPALDITDISSLDSASEYAITFLTSAKYLQALLSTKARVCIINKEHICARPGIYLLVVTDPYAAYALTAQMFYPERIPTTAAISDKACISATAKIGHGCHVMPFAFVGDGAQIGDNCRIYPNAYIGDNVVIGNNCTIHSNVSITNSIVGDNFIAHAGAKIGQDGFGYAQSEGKHIKIPQIGRVIIGNDVEIGANSTIDRGAIEDTKIGDMCKIDNLVQIGHNVQLGYGCVVVSQVGIAGGVKVGKYAMLGGQVGIAGHLTIGDYSQIGAQSGIIQDVEPGAKLFGTPAVPIREFFRQVTMLKKLTKVDVK